MAHDAGALQTRFAFDLDATLTRIELLDQLARQLLSPQDAQDFVELTHQGRKDPLAYEQALAARMALLARCSLADIHNIVAQVPLAPRLSQWVKAHREQCLIVTHNFAAWVAPLTDPLGCRVVGSTPRWDKGHIVGLASANRKSAVTQALVARGHTVIAIGDGINDAGMFQASHWGIAWGGVHPPAPQLAQVAQECIDDETTLCARLDELCHRPAQAFLSPALRGVYQAIAQRRDIREFIPNSEIDATTLGRLRRAFYQAPNVGLMQPGRVLEIESPKLREELANIVDQERQATAIAYAEQEGRTRSEDFLALKVEGIRSCAKLWVVALRDKRDHEIFGRRTMPHMDLASVACAIQNLWLAARAEGLGMGWVSLFCPHKVAELLGIPQGAQPVAILCLGPAKAFLDRPKLQQDGWRDPIDLSHMFHVDQWPSEQTRSPSSPSKTELVLGGQRSGKSAYAEQLCQNSGKELHYVATCQALDTSMHARIAAHQSRRGKDWVTHEAPLQLAATLQELDDPQRCILVDCLTLWLSNCLHHECWPAERDQLLEIIPRLQGQLYLVGSLVGQGVIPMQALSRQFVDHIGTLYQDLAKRCSHVTQVTAGLPTELKYPGRVQ